MTTIRFNAPSLEARALFFRKNYWRIQQILAGLSQVATFYDQDSPAPLRIVLNNPPIHVEETKTVLGFEEINQEETSPETSFDFEASPQETKEEQALDFDFEEENSEEEAEQEESHTEEEDFEAEFDDL